MKKKVLIGMAVVLIALLTGCIRGVDSGPVSDQYDVYMTDAPFGKYWTETDGQWVYFLFGGSGSLGSELRESYTIKYYDGDELCTLILKSTDARLHVHLTDNNSTMNLEVKLWWDSDYERQLSNWKYWVYQSDDIYNPIDFEFHLTIPDPSLYKNQNNS